MVGLSVLLKNIGYLLKVLFIEYRRFVHQKRNFISEFQRENLEVFQLNLQSLIIQELFGAHLVLILSVVFCCFLWSLVVGKLFSIHLGSCLVSCMVFLSSNCVLFSFLFSVPSMFSFQWCQVLASMMTESSCSFPTWERNSVSKLLVIWANTHCRKLMNSVANSRYNSRQFQRQLITTSSFFNLPTSFFY